MVGVAWRRALFVLIPLLTALSVIGTSDAAFRDTAASSGNSFSATTLQPPSGVTATHQCLLGIRSMRVSWTASPSTIATRYRVLKSVNGGSYSSVATVAYGTNSWTDNSISGSTTYGYRVRTERSGTTWQSSDAQSGAVTTPSLCL